MSFRAILLLAVYAAIAPASISEGGRNWYEPHFLTSQAGGYVGMVTAGFGYHMSKQWDTEFIYGYVPEIVGGEDLHQVSWKNTLHPFQHRFKRDKKTVGRLSIFYMGATIIYGFDDDLFLELPDRYPDDYYTPSALHAAFNLGLSARYLSHGLFLEAVTSNVGINAVYRNPGHFSAGDIISYAAGYRFYLK